MASSQRETQVGLIVLISGIVLIVGMLWFKQVRFTGGTMVYYVDFPSVDALQVRDRVQVRGIRMGTVAKLGILEDYVRVTIRVDREANLRQDAQIRLGTIGIVGEKVIEINPGQGEPAPEHYIFEGAAELSMSSMGSVAGEALEQIRDLASELRTFLNELSEQGQLVETLNAAKEAAAGLGGTLRDNREPIRRLLGDIQATAEALRQALTGPDSVLTHVATGVSHSLTRADSVLVEFQQVSGSLAQIMDRLEQGQGSAGRLLMDEGLYARAESTLANIEELVRDVRRNPRRYFKFSVIDF